MLIYMLPMYLIYWISLKASCHLILYLIIFSPNQIAAFINISIGVALCEYKMKKGRNYDSDFTSYYTGDNNFTKKFNFAEVLWQ